MAQFDVYENGNAQSRETYPLLLDIQADILRDLNTRIIVPLSLSSVREKPLVFTPLLTIRGKKYRALFNLMASYPVAELGTGVAANLVDSRSTLMAAYDFVIQGY
jgi:toxin CcdB